MDYIVQLKHHRKYSKQYIISENSFGKLHTICLSDSGGYGSHSGDDHKPKGGYLAQRKPGPYGYPTPNFKCEYAKETLYVTKTDWTFDKKCFTVFRTKCRQEYEHGKGIGFEKECSEFTVTRCRTEYDTESETKCWTVFRKECFQVYVTKVDWEYEEKCETKTEEVCTGYGYDKHCEHVPKESCHQVRKHLETIIQKDEAIFISIRTRHATYAMPVIMQMMFRTPIMLKSRNGNT